MAEAARVLVIGDDREAMTARAEVLRHFWEVELLTPGEEAGVEGDLVVVNAMLSEAEREAVIRRVREQRPSVLIVKENGFESGPHAGTDATVNVARGPGALISCIYQLLTERGLPSREWPVGMGPVVQ